MKTVILVRHSEPDKCSGAENENIPLSENGRLLAKRLFQNDAFNAVSVLYSSPYKRAYETAQAIGTQIVADERLSERKLGNKELLDECFWKRQYLDLDYKNIGGESFNEVKLRMTSCINEMLNKINEGEKAVAVSHAAAICSYLLNFCKVSVVDAKEKLREIKYADKVVMCGKIKTPSAFVLMFYEDGVGDVVYID